MTQATLIKNSNNGFHPSILREYDIRGIIGETLNNEDAFLLGQAFGTKVIQQKGQNIFVAYDGRHSSPDLVKNLIEGLTSTGCDVVDIGLGPSPMLYFAVKEMKADAGIMITGSHNPSNYNGFKMMMGGKSVFGEDIQTLGQIASDGIFEKGTGSVSKKDVSQDYIARLLKDLSVDRELTIAWDNGNGASGNILKDLVSQIPGNHHLLYEDVDGDFPNHHPDPTVDKNLEDLISLVKEKNCDLGIAFDGDGDRIGVVDETGNIIRGDLLLSIYAKDILKKSSNKNIIADVKCSSLLFEEIKKLGGEPVMSQTGHSLVKNKMLETNAPLAGELSGHIFFNDIYYGFDDALYCAIRLINIVSHGIEPLSSYVSHFPKMFSTPEIRIDVPEEDKFNLIRSIEENLESNPDIQANTLDGVRVTTDEGWWLLRASNTQNCLVTRVEAKTQPGMQNLQSMVEEALKDVHIQFSFTGETK
ncbi:MAG: phosphomannomutase/phosphoglucomutase [Pseudomonadota bacterium]